MAIAKVTGVLVRVIRHQPVRAELVEALLFSSLDERRTALRQAQRERISRMENQMNSIFDTR
jgi:hypothetical protein